MPKQVIVTINGTNYPGTVGLDGRISYIENELVFRSGQYFQVNTAGALTPFNPTTAYMSTGNGLIEAPILLNNTPASPPTTSQWLQNNIGDRLASNPTSTASSTSGVRLPSNTFAPAPEPTPLASSQNPMTQYMHENRAPVQATKTGHLPSEQKPFMQELMSSRPVLGLTALASGYGLYKGIQAMSEQFDGGAMLSMIYGAQQYLSSTTGFLKKAFDMGDGNASALALGSLVVIGLAGKFIKTKKDNGAGPNDPSPLPNASTGGTQTNSSTSTTTSQTQTPPTTGPWYRQISSTNVLMITAATALMVLGLNLGGDGPSSKFIKKDATELQGVRNALDASVGGGRLPSIGTSVLGKVFVQSSQNNGLTPDKIVYVSQDSVGTADKPADYSVNMLTLDYDGHVVSPNMPDVSYIPFFYRNANGAVVPTPQGNAAVARERALALAASSENTSTTGAAGATRLSGTNHN